MVRKELSDFALTSNAAVDLQRERLMKQRIRSVLDVCVEVAAAPPYHAWYDRVVSRQVDRAFRHPASIKTKHRTCLHSHSLIASQHRIVRQDAQPCARPPFHVPMTCGCRSVSCAQSLDKRARRVVAATPWPLSWADIARRNGRYAADERAGTTHSLCLERAGHGTVARRFVYGLPVLPIAQYKQLSLNYLYSPQLNITDILRPHFH